MFFPLPHLKLILFPPYGVTCQLITSAETGYELTIDFSARPPSYDRNPAIFEERKTSTHYLGSSKKQKQNGRRIELGCNEANCVIRVQLVLVFLFTWYSQASVVA